MKSRYFIHTAILVVLTLTLMGLIFSFSSQTGPESGSISREVTEVLVRFFTPDYDSLSSSAQKALINRWHTPVRKAAHMTEYALLGALFMLILGRIRRVRLPALWSALLTFLSASADEFHQSFVAGRGPSFVDVLIDMSGAVIGISLAALLLCIIFKRRNKKQEAVDGGKRANEA